MSYWLQIICSSVVIHKYVVLSFFMSHAWMKKLSHFSQKFIYVMLVLVLICVSHA